VLSPAQPTVLSESLHTTPIGNHEEISVADAPTPPPDHTGPPKDAVTVTLTYTGSEAEALRTLALLESRTPEEVALDHIARGIPLIFSSALGEDPNAMAALTRAMFDGPADLAKGFRHPRCVAANIRSTAGRRTTDGPAVASAFARSCSSASGVVRTPGTPKDSASAT